MKLNNTIIFLGLAALLVFGARPVNGIGAIKKEKKISVYSSDGKTNIAHLQNKSGVYLIYNGSQLRYIGMSGSNLYKTITRHFQSWTDHQERVTYPQSTNYKVRIVTCTPAQAAKLERALIVKHKPVDNPNKYEQYILKLDDKNIIEQYEEAPF